MHYSRDILEYTLQVLSKSRDNYDYIMKKSNHSKPLSRNSLEPKKRKSKHNLQITKSKKQQIDSPFRLRSPKENEKYRNFKVQQFLGKGKYGDVFLGREITTDFRVALKVINKQRIAEQKMEKQLAEEIKIQLTQSHPNIVRLFTFFQTAEEIVLVMEYCSDGGLNQVLNRQLDLMLPEDQAARYIRQTLEALNYLHRKYIIHRDIKLENLLLSFDQVKLADFSLSIYSPTEMRKTLCGSLAYSSPEILNGQQYDKKIDVWAIGILSYELCAGESPWENSVQIELAIQKFQRQIHFPSHFSAALKDFIDKSLKIDVDERPSAQQLLNHEWVREKAEQKFNQIDFEI